MASRSSLKCANGSDLHVTGYAVMNVKLGSHIIQTKFTVVDKLSPNVILGMKFMKKLDISLNPSEQCIKIYRPGSQFAEVVPFISQSAGSAENE